MTKRREPVGMHSSELEHAMEAMGAPEAYDFHRAENAERTGVGICRTCVRPIWNEGGTIGRRRVETGWSDRWEIDGLVCFKARDYRHVPLTGREAYIYDHAYQTGRSEA